MEEDKVIFLFDGICVLCNAGVDFILRHDKRDRFRFASLQSETGKKILDSFSEKQVRMDSAAVIENGKIYFLSDAVLHLLKNLGGGWRLLFVFSIIPPFIRNAIYRYVATHRYDWFGKRESCRLPDEITKAKFLS